MTAAFREVLPKTGILYHEDTATTVLCKPKLMSMKSVTLEKLDKMQKDAQETVRQQDLEESKNEMDAFGLPMEKASSSGEQPDVLGEDDMIL